MAHIITLPSKKEIKDLANRGLFRLEDIKITNYAELRLSERTLDPYNICTIDFNNKSALIGYLYAHFDTDGNFMPYVTHYSTRFKRCSIKKNPDIGIVPIIQLPPDELRQFVSRSEEVDGKKIVKYGKFEYRYLSKKEIEELDKELEKGNVAYYKYSNSYTTKDIYIYKGKKYTPARNLDGTVNWIELRDLEWIIDEEGSKLICTNIIDYLNCENIYNYLDRLEAQIDIPNLPKFEETLLLTPNENVNNLPFVDFEKEALKELIQKYKSEDTLYTDADIFKDMMFGSYEDKVNIRPAIDYKYIKDKSVLIKSHKDYDEVYYGEYPQVFLHDEEENILETNYSKEKLSTTGKVYTSCHISNKDGFQVKEYPEYEYNGNKYIRIGEYRWVKVCPIKWYVDKKTNIAISPGSLVYFIIEDSKDIKVNDVDINNYLRKCFSKEIEPRKVMEEKLRESRENIITQIIMKKYNLSENDIDFDSEGKQYIRSMSRGQNSGK